MAGKPRVHPVPAFNPKKCAKCGGTGRLTDADGIPVLVCTVCRPSGGVTCRKCHGRIGEDAFEYMRKLTTARGKPFRRPKLCLDCWFVALLEMAETDDEATPPPESPPPADEPAKP